MLPGDAGRSTPTWRRIVSHHEPERGDKPELSDAARILADEAARREALFEQSFEAEKNARRCADAPVRGGAEAGEGGAVTKPMRDFDLD